MCGRADRWRITCLSPAQCVGTVRVRPSNHSQSMLVRGSIPSSRNSFLVYHVTCCWTSSKTVDVEVVAHHKPRCHAQVSAIEARDFRIEAETGSRNIDAPRRYSISVERDATRCAEGAGCCARKRCVLRIELDPLLLETNLRLESTEKAVHHCECM